MKIDAERAGTPAVAVQRGVRPCSCGQCVSLCERNPGWMTPDEAMKAIAAGHRNRLMRDWLEPCSELGNDERIYLLAAASIGCEGADAPEFGLMDMMDMLMGNCSKGQCTFLKDGLCEIHQTDYKPKQCRESLGCEHSGPDNYEMARLWNTNEGLKALAAWSND
jgi:hypothetical protein